MQQSACSYFEPSSAHHKHSVTSPKPKPNVRWLILAFWSQTQLKLSEQYKLQVSNYIFQVLHSNIDEIKSSLFINNQIYSHNTIINNQMSILRVNFAVQFCRLWYCAVKFPIISFVVIIRIIRNVIVSWIGSWCVKLL